MTPDEIIALLQRKVSELSDSLESLTFSFYKKTGPGSNNIEGADMQSVNFASGSSGWKLDSSGNLEANNGNFRGDITGASGTFSGTVTVGSLDIPDAVTASSFHVDNDGDTWWGATTLAAAIASISKAGIGTFIGLTSLNMKAYTNFEASGRFINTSGGTGSATFGNQGVTVAPGATATSYHRMLWWITNHVFSNNPSFVASFLCLGLNNASGSAQAYVGLGNVGVDGNGHTLGGVDNAGFFLQKTSGVTSLYAVCSDGSGGFNLSAALTTLADNDSVEVFIKLKSSSVDFYYRKNGGALSAATTFTTLLPSGSEDYIHFSSTNKGTAFNYQIQFQCAAYEH